jgi:hypothetical protein
VLARHSLETLRRKPEDGPLLSRVSQVLRHYFQAAFELAPEELTTTEFCQALAGKAQAGSDLTSSVSEFLRRCDERKFALSAPQPALGAAEQALSIIQSAEARREQLRQAALCAPEEKGGRP